MSWYTAGIIPLEEKQKAFFTRWCDKECYTHKLSVAKPAICDETKWADIHTFLKKAFALSCFSDLEMLNIIGLDNIDWAEKNPDQILVIYSGRVFNLEIKYTSEIPLELQIRLFKV